MQQWIVETPVSAVVIADLPEKEKSLAKEYRVDEAVTAVFRHRDEPSTARLSVWHCGSALDAFGAVSRRAAERKLPAQSGWYSSDTVCVASKGRYAVFSETSSPYLTSQGDLLKSVRFILEKIPSAGDALPMFLNRTELSDIVYCRDPQKNFFAIGDSFSGKFSFKGTTVASYWAEFDTVEAAETAFSSIIKALPGHTITDYSKEKKMYAENAGGYASAVQRGKSVVFCAGSPESGTGCAAALSALLYP
jgi:hypothetical protein